MTYDPGDGTHPLTCEGRSSLYDPDGPDFVEQARDGCAHVYEYRSGPEGRPGEWPAEISVAWDIEWSADNGTDGTLPAVILTTPLPRDVNAIEAVIVSDPD